MNCKRVLMELFSTQRNTVYQQMTCPPIQTRCYTYSVYKRLRARLPVKLPHRCAHVSRPAPVQPVLKPLEKLQKYSTVPLLPKEDVLFDPTEAEIRNAQNLFLPGPNHKIAFLKSAVFTEHLPEYDLSEVAFIGRSNVGKSSLIQILLSGVRGLEVKISKTPGHTRTLNFFQLGQKLSIVDMPGYGHRMPDHYVQSVENFLNSRPNLKMTFVLVDGKIGLTPLDEQKLNAVRDMNTNYCIVMTKIDKTVPSRLIKNFMNVLKHRDNTTYCFQQPFLVSSMTGDGVALLQSFIAYVSGNFKPEGL